MDKKEPENKEEPKLKAQSVEDNPVISAQGVSTLPTFPFSAVGTILGYATGTTPPASPAGYSPLAWLEDDFSFDSVEINEIEVKPLSSKVVYRLPGRFNCSGCSGTMSLVTGDTGFNASQTNFFSRTMLWWCVQLPDGTNANNTNTGSYYTFQGFFSNFTPGGFTGEDKLGLSFKIAVNGLVNYFLGS